MAAIACGHNRVSAQSCDDNHAGTIMYKCGGTIAKGEIVAKGSRCGRRYLCTHLKGDSVAQNHKT